MSAVQSPRCTQSQSAHTARNNQLAAMGLDESRDAPTPMAIINVCPPSNGPSGESTEEAATSGDQQKKTANLHTMRLWAN